MGRKAGNTDARKKAMVSDCMKQIAKKNIRHKDWVAYATDAYDITTRRAEMLWTMAWDELRAQFAKDAEVNLIQAVSRLDDLYEEASKSGYDFNSQVNILKEKHKIMGMYTEKQEIKQEVDIRFDFDE
jgi:hypothetical protein